jgi:hypothetical protein
MDGLRRRRWVSIGHRLANNESCLSHLLPPSAGHRFASSRSFSARLSLLMATSLLLPLRLLFILRPLRLEHVAVDDMGLPLALLDAGEQLVLAQLPLWQ